MCFDEDAEMIGEKRAFHLATTGEWIPPIFNDMFADAENRGFFNMLEMINDVGLDIVQ